MQSGVRKQKGGMGMPGFEKAFSLNDIVAGFRHLLRDRRGITALEYGIMASFFCVVLVTIFLSFGSTLKTMMSGVDSSL